MGQPDGVSAQGTARRYVLAVVYPLVAVLALELWPTLATVWRWLVLLGAILLAGWNRGVGPAFLSLGVGAGLAMFSWLPPRWSLRDDRPGDRLALGLFVGLGVVLMLLEAWLPRDRRPTR